MDTIGLRISADLGGTEEGRRLYEEIQGGYIDKMSFAFTVRKSEYDRATHTRRITAFQRIFDVAAVDFPAYDGTEIVARSWAAAEAAREHAQAEAMRRKLELKLKLCGIQRRTMPMRKIYTRDLIGLQFCAAPPAGDRLSQIEARLSQIRTEMDQEGADLEALSNEVDNLIAERGQLKQGAETRAALLRKIGTGAVGNPLPGNAAARRSRAAQRDVYP